MFIAIRDLAFAKGRFLLMGLVVTLVAFLTTFLSGLSQGLISNNISGLLQLPAGYVSLQYDDRPTFRGSLIERAQWEAWAAKPGVLRSAPMGHTTFTARGQNNEPLELVLWGVPPDSFLVPGLTAGQALGTNANGVIISALLASRGVRIGDTLTLDRVLTELEVIGTTGEQNYEHIPIVYAPLRIWQEATYGPPGGAAPGEKLPDVLYDYASLVALDLQPGFDRKSVDEELDTTTMTIEESFSTSQAYSVEINTVAAIQGFLIFTATMLIGAFFTIWTIQRTHEIGLVKALGASNGYLLRDSLGQALIVMGSGTIVGVVAGLTVGLSFRAIVGPEFPFMLKLVPVLSSAMLLLVAGLVGGAISIRLITRVDPIIALGRET
jgi:putative ABC transport system permease protein